MIFRLIALLPMLVCVCSLGVAADSFYLAATLASLATVLAIAGPRWELDLGRQMLTSAIGAGVGYAIAAALYEAQAGSLGEGFTRLAAALVLAAAARFLIISPRGGRLTMMALAFASLVASGETRGQGYVIFVVLFLVTSLWAIGTNRHQKERLESSTRRIAVGAAVLSFALASGLGTTVGLRRLHSWLLSRAHSSAFIWRPRVGFSDQMDLGALDGLLDSDSVVLRVHGPRVDYLRGAPLDVYEGGRWLRSDQAQVETAAMLDRPLGSVEEPALGDVVEIAAVSDRTERFFLPLQAHQIVTTPAAVLVDDLGSIKRTTKHVLLTARFVPGARDRAGVAPPRPQDLQLPRRIRPALEKIALEWIGAATTAEAKLDAIENHLLTEYHYSRTFQRSAGSDPAIDFLLRGKTGHCEYFATALALVARAAKIPARVVMGYRVGERSPFGYYVVRERNAHAWVEPWIEGQGWTTHDATPESFLPQNREHEAGYAASAIDALRVAYIDLTDWLGRLTLQQTAIAWFAGFIVLIWIVARGARRRRKPTALVPADEAALPFLEQLLSLLARAGYPRRDSEPVERLAARLTDPQVSRLLERYAALRYGSIGDAGSLAHDITVYARSAPREGQYALSRSNTEPPDDR